MPLNEGRVGSSVGGGSYVRPDALADMPGVPELSLTRAVVLYWDRQVLGSTPGRHADDIGLGVVMEGSYPASCAVLDLGSTRIQEVDLSGELLVLGWVREETLSHIGELLEHRGAAREDLLRSTKDEVAPYCFALGLRVLEHTGFTSLSRTAFLRISFRDLCRDLDPQSPQGIRVDMGSEGIARIALNSDDLTLVVTVDQARDALSVETSLAKAFSALPLRRALKSTDHATMYEARMPLPTSVSEVRALMRTVRAGVDRLLSKFEPVRHAELSKSAETFGHRDTLLRFLATGSAEGKPGTEAPTIPTLSPAVAENATVH